MNAGKSNDKRILVPTDISVGVKVVKSNSSNGTIQRKTAGHCSREKLNGRFLAYSYWILVCISFLFLVEAYPSVVECLDLVFRIDSFFFGFWVGCLHLQHQIKYQNQKGSIKQMV